MANSIHYKLRRGNSGGMMGIRWGELRCWFLGHEWQSVPKPYVVKRDGVIYWRYRCQHCNVIEARHTDISALYMVPYSYLVELGVAEEVSDG